MALSALLFAATPARAQFNPATLDLPDTPIALSFDAEQDAAIATRIRAILDALDGFEEVEVAVTVGVVTLSGQVIDEPTIMRLEQIVRRIEGVVAINDRVTASTNIVERLAPIFARFSFRMWQTLAYLPLIIVALASFVVIYLIGVTVAGTSALWRRLAPNKFIARIYAQIVKLVFAIAGLVVALDILGASALLGSILGAAGIIGLAIGFAVRDTVENFIASVMLSIRQPFGPFDTIEIGGDVGKVVRLTSRATIMLSPDGNLIRVPNATVFKSRLINFSRNPERRFTFTLDVDPGADIAALREALQGKLAKLPFVLAEPAPLVWLIDDTGSAVRLGFAAWIDQRETSWEQARGEAIRIMRGALTRLLAAPTLAAKSLIEGGGPPPVGAAPPAPAESDFDDAPLPVLANTEERDLARLVKAERDSPEVRDLLGTAAPKE